MTTKLIIVEGLPGSGKSTTAKAIYNILSNKKINVELFSEGDHNHPVDFDGVAYFSNEEFHKLQCTYLSSKDILDNVKIKYYEGFLIPFRKAIEENQISFDKELFNDITKNDIYELQLDVHKELILNRWDEFVNNYINIDKVVIFECCFIQNPVTVTMVRDGCKKEITKNYINSLARIIKPLNPLLLYIEQDSIDKSFKKVVNERPKEWFQGFKNYYTNQGYGLTNNFKGIEGTIQVLKERSFLEREIYDLLKIDKYRVDNSKFDSAVLNDRINLILENYI